MACGMSAYTYEAALRVGAAKRGLRIDLGLQISRVLDCLEFGHGASANGWELWWVRVRGGARRACFSVVHGVQLGGRTLRVVAIGAHVGLYGGQLGRMWSRGYTRIDQYSSAELQPRVLA